ncbi:MAG: helix-turn-helix domain-containing protein [Gemmatimonadetes bacterium]|nr:helix-turn-helix domain-containing protein [Gemmatimonadota bacterium]MYE18304.1 helix-turn-helix domain-containing protein [Gemmatimonadota bacterium]
MTQTKGQIGSSFEHYLAEQGTLEETTASAVKRVLAWQLEQAMERQQITKSAMARAMRTSRSQLDRILDPDNDHIRLDTLTAAANVLGLNVRIELIG